MVFPQSKEEKESNTVKHPPISRGRDNQDQEESHIHTQTPPQKANGPDQQRLWTWYLNIQEGLRLLYQYNNVMPAVIFIFKVCPYLF